MNPEVSIVIVSFNTRDITKQCLASIFEFTKGVVFEIIVVDNGSVDGSPEIIEAEFPSVRMIRNDRNTGFAAAQNRGMLATSGAYILVLNSDIVFTADSITAMADEL